MQAAGLETYKSVAYFEWQHAKHGGLIGDISVGGDALPAGAIITGGLIHTKEALAGSGALMAIRALSGGDILAATEITQLTENALLAPVPVPDNAGTWIRLPSNLTALIFTPSVAAVTAGRIVVGLEYFVTTE